MKINYPDLEKIIEKLSAKKQTISFAESCTGGRLAASFTSISGASTVFHGSVVSYSNDIKKAWLGVTQETLEKHGAVSSQCVKEMLEGISTMTDTLKSDYAIAISGIAGPNGGTKEKPVGTVYIGLNTPTNQTIYKCLFKGDREQVQEQSTLLAIEKLKEVLEI
ncbi:MAG: Unknown protein [uncultured Sulfurovum sp.]|uniref:CinA C-terminal domain-containing protein n=1 Tax=uncultured Sulfurovum sp. TaxID=269237 RepID=A0A6S6SAF3_9BACT|nr:MAG: Unknown protein [uncultured Sulfurovum sp.]